MNNTIKRGDIFFYDFGENSGSIQSGKRPVLVIQADNFNEKAPTIIVAAVTSVVKKQYLPSHVILPDDIGLQKKSMVLLEQIRAVNKADLVDRLGFVDDTQTWKAINNGIKKTFGLWVYNRDRTGDIRCLCPKCLEDYKSNPSIIVKRLDPFKSEKDRCDKCDRPGYDYLVYDKRSLH
jgi:mRNA interferase MazF